MNFRLVTAIKKYKTEKKLQIQLNFRRKNPFEKERKKTGKTIKSR